MMTDAWCAHDTPHVMMSLLTNGGGPSETDPGHDWGVYSDNTSAMTRRPGLTRPEFVLMSDVE